MQKILVVSVIVAVVAGGLGFYGGMTYGKSQKSSDFANFTQNGQRQFAAQGGQNGGSGAMRGTRAGQAGGALSGQIIAKDDKSVTIKLANGSTKIAFFSASTQVGQFTTSSVADLQLQKDVMIIGQTNADGSVTAQSIQVREVTGMGFGRPDTTSTPSVPVK